MADDINSQNSIAGRPLVLQTPMGNITATPAENGKVNIKAPDGSTAQVTDAEFKALMQEIAGNSNLTGPSQDTFQKQNKGGSPLIGAIVTGGVVGGAAGGVTYLVSNPIKDGKVKEKATEKFFACVDEANAKIPENVTKEAVTYKALNESVTRYENIHKELGEISKKASDVQLSALKKLISDNPKEFNIVGDNVDDIAKNIDNMAKTENLENLTNSMSKNAISQRRVANSAKETINNVIETYSKSEKSVIKEATKNGDETAKVFSKAVKNFKLKNALKVGGWVGGILAGVTLVLAGVSKMSQKQSHM